MNMVSKPNTNVLGRWALETCDKKTNSKVDWSNTDHCGTCSYEKLETPSKDRHLENTNSHSLTQIDDKSSNIP